MIYNHDRHTLAYATYDPKENMIVIAFRGSNGMDYKNWKTNLHSSQSAFNDDQFPGAKIHNGFFNAYGAVRD